MSAFIYPELMWNRWGSRLCIKTRKASWRKQKWEMSWKGEERLRPEEGMGKALEVQEAPGMRE